MYVFPAYASDALQATTPGPEDTGLRTFRDLTQLVGGDQQSVSATA